MTTDKELEKIFEGIEMFGQTYKEHHCFPNALIWSNKYENAHPEDKTLLVHGEYWVADKDNPEGGAMKSHAWVEINETTAVDPTVKIQWPIDKYYNTFKIKPLMKFTPTQGYIMLSRIGKHGAYTPNEVERVREISKEFKNYQPLKEAKMEKFQEIIQSNELLAKGLRLCAEIEKVGGEGAQCIVVGGAVRDLLVGREIDDVDLATNVAMEEIEKHFKVDEIGANKEFGILNVHFEGEQFEVAHFRTETGYSDSRHPDKVEMVNTFELDSARRDFTFNAMGLTKDGEIIDYHGGMEDLKNKLLKAVGEPKKRFQEDVLRLLRAARQAASLGVEIESNTKEAIQELKETIKTASMERVAQEMYKAAKSGSILAKYIEHLDDLGLMQIIFPEMYALKPFQHSLKHHPEYEGNVYGHVLGCLYASRSNNPITNIAILGHDFGKAVTYRFRDGHKHTYYGHEGAGVPIVEAMGKRLKMSGEDIEIMKFCAAKHMLIHKLYELTRPKIIELVNHPYWQHLKDTAYADEKSRLHLFNEQDFARKIKHAEDIAEEVNLGGGPEGLKKRLKNLVNGNKLLEWIPDLNQPENRPLIGRLMKATHEWILLKNEFNLTEKTVHDFVIDKYEQFKNPKNLKEFINL